MLGFIRRTVNETGLQVKTFLVEEVFENGIKVAAEIFQAIYIQSQEICNRWNHTIRPHLACT